MLSQSPTLVSVIIPCYNRKDTLKRALDSVKKQTYRPIEVVIIDDGSSDNTIEFLKKYNFGDLSFQIIQNKTNRGIGNSRNEGINKSKGELLAFLDSDDEWILEEKIYKQVFFLKQNKEYGLVGTGWVNEESTPIDNEGFFFRDDDSFRKIALKTYPVHTSSLVIKKNIIDKAGYFWNKKSEDYEFILRVGTKTKCYCLNIISTKYYNAKIGDRKSRLILSFMMGTYISYLYRNNYPGWFSALCNRLKRATLKISYLFKNQ